MWHTENDCSYKLVSVQKQDCVNENVLFIKLNFRKYIGVSMKSGVSYISSVNLLTYGCRYE